jgi:hypothetical protein
VEKLLGSPNSAATFDHFGAFWTYRFDWTPFSGRVIFDGNGRVDGWLEPSEWNLNE